MQYKNILIEMEGPIATLTLNRPQKLNALSFELMEELATSLEKLDQDEAVRVIILTGNERAFSAGADIVELADFDAVDMIKHYRPQRWERIRRIGKPIIAAVSGYCVGGGNELAMACDLIVASETARFGQPEINLGVIPGAGGTQRLTRALGKARALELVLTGESISAQEAYQRGLINRVVPAELFMDEAKRLARLIAEKPPLAVRLGKEAVLRALDTPLELGLEYERKAFFLLFASRDKREGMRAFFEKRAPEFKGE